MKTLKSEGAIALYQGLTVLAIAPLMILAFLLRVRIDND